MPKIARAALVLALAASNAILVGTARADATPAEAHAAQLFESGRALAKEGRCVEAIPVLLESVKAVEGVGALLNLGLCLEQTEKTYSAHRYFLRAEALAASRGDPRSADAHERALALEKRLSRLTVRVTLDAQAEPDLSILMDGDPLPRDRWNVAAYVDPGVHSVVASSSIRPSTALRVVVRAEADNAELVVPALAPSASTSPPESGGARATGEAGTGKQRTLGWVLGGVGATAFAVGGVFGVLSLVDHGSLDSLHPRRRDSPAPPESRGP
jgi:hypothetical protein